MHPSGKNPLLRGKKILAMKTVYVIDKANGAVLALVDYLTAQIPFAKQMNESMIEVVIDFAKKHVAR